MPLLPGGACQSPLESACYLALPSGMFGPLPPNCLYRYSEGIYYKKKGYEWTLALYQLAILVLQARGRELPALFVWYVKQGLEKVQHALENVLQSFYNKNHAQG